MSEASSGSHKRPPLRTLIIRGVALALLLAASSQAGRLPANPIASAIMALGMLVLGGDLLAQIAEPLGLPHLTGYLVAGIALGPFGLHAVSHQDGEALSLVNALALALIALSAGAELTLDLLRRGLRSLLWAVLMQVLITLPILVAAFFLLRQWIDFAAHLSTLAALGVAILWGVIGVSRSPSATLGVIAQLEPRGPLTRYTLGLVVSFDILVLVLFALALQLGHALVAGGGMDLAELGSLGQELVGSGACGITLGLLVTAYLRFVDRENLLFLLLVSYGVTEFSTYFHFDTLLLFVAAGFIVANVSAQGGKLLAGVSQGGRVVYVLFFANAGAHLDLGLLSRLWPVALGLVAIRIVATAMATVAGARLARDPPAIVRYGWMPLVSQAGVTIGMAVIVANAFPSFGEDFRGLAIAVVGINETIGPILFKTALEWAREVGPVAKAETAVSVVEA